MFKRLSLWLMLGLIAASALFAQRPSEVFLRDAGAIKLAFTGLPEWMSDLELTGRDLAQKIAFVLRAGGIPMADNENAEILKVSIEGMEAKVGDRNFGYFFSVRFELLQLTNPIGSNQLERAITWTGYAIEVSPDARALREDLQRTVTTQAESLVNSILAARGR